MVLGSLLQLHHTSILPHPPPSIKLSRSLLHPPSKHVSLRASHPTSLLLAHQAIPDDIQHLLLELEQAQPFEEVPERMDHCTWLVGKLAEQQRLSELAALLQALVRTGADAQNLTQAVDMREIQLALDAAIAQGNADIAVDVLNKLHEAGFCSFQFLRTRGIRSLSRELKRMVLGGYLDDCICLLQSLSDIGFSVKNLMNPSFMIRQCMKMQRVGAALRYASLLPKVCNHYNIMICESGKQGNLEAAFTIFHTMKKAGIFPDLYTYRSMIDACCWCGVPRKADIIFKELQKENAIPNVFVYNSYMNAHVQDLKQVLSIYENMQKAEVAADLTTYNILLKSYCLVGKADLAQNLYRDLQKQARSGEMKLDVVTYSTIIQALGKAKMWEMALDVKSDMLMAGITPNIITWTSVIGACAHAGLVDKAFHVFDEMLSTGCKPNAQCYNILLHACVEAGQPERAFRLFEEWNSSGKISPSFETNKTCDEMSQKTCIFDKKVKILNTKSSSVVGNTTLESTAVRYNKTASLAGNTVLKPNAVTYNILLKASKEIPHRTRAIIKEMEELGLTANQKSWSILIDAYGSAGDLQGAIQAFEEMQALGIKPDVITYTSLIKACVQIKDANKAFSFLDMMKKEGVRPNKVTYSTLLRTQRTCGGLYEVQRALSLYEEMREVGFSPDESLLKGLLEEWAEGVIQDGKNEETHLSRNDFQGNPKQLNSLKYTDLLLQRVAVHACHNCVDQNLVIDLHGLTQTEARIAVLAVLRILKERYLKEEAIQDDLVIITGIGKHSEIPGVSVIREVVLDVLENELRLPVVCMEDLSFPENEMHKARPEVSTRMAPTADDSSLEFLNQTGSKRVEHVEVLDATSSVVARKPMNLGRLRVPKEILCGWLRKKAST